MLGELDILDALSQPIRALFDPGERIYWVFLLTSLAMPLLLLGVRRGAVAIRHGLLRGGLWTSPSSRADVTLMFLKAVVFGLLKIPWLTATTGAALWVGLSLHAWLGPAPTISWSPATVTLVYSLLLFVVWDASRFALHWAMHRVPVLWELHQVHHSATVLTPLTLYRTHPLEAMLVDLRGLLTTAAVAGVFAYLWPGSLRAAEILGISALGLVFNAAGSNLRHSHVWLRFGRFERWLVSPAQHQLHHARDPIAHAQNLGTWLAIWDRWARTWAPAPEQPPSAYGLDRPNHDPHRAGSMLVAPLRSAASVAWRRAPLAVGLGLLAVPPTASARTPDRDAPDPAAVPWPDAPPAQAPVAPQPAAPENPGPPPEPAPLESARVVAEDDVRTVVVSSMFDRNAWPGEAGSAHVVDEEELERREYDDVHRVLATVPGVYVRGEDGFGLRPNIGLRGANPDRSAKVNLMEDAVLMGPAPYSAPAAYYFPLMTRMTAVEVFKGPASIKYGPNTIGGAINFRTREIPKTHTSEIDLAGGRFGYFKAHGYYGTTINGFGILAEAVRVQTQGFKQLDGGGDTGFAKNDAMLKLAYEANPTGDGRHRVEAKVGFATEDSDETYLGLTAADFEANPYRRYAASSLDKMQWWRSQAELGYLFQQGKTIEFDVRLYRHDFDRLWRRLDGMRGAPVLGELLASPTAGQAAVLVAILRGEQDSVLPQHTLLLANNDRRFVSQGVQAAFRWRPSWRVVEQELEIGARIHNDSITRRHTEDAFLMSAGQLVPEGIPRVDTARNRGEAVAAAFHVYDAVTLWKRFIVTPGARVEVIDFRYTDDLADQKSRRLDVAVTPGVGALVLATPWLGVFAGVHRGFSPVTPGQPRAVKPEYSMNYEAGLRAHWRGLHAEAVGFLSDYGNLTGVCTFSSGCTEDDGARLYEAGEVLVWGTELLASYRHDFRYRLYLDLGGRYTYTGSRFKSDFESSFPQWADVREGDALPYVPEHVASGSIAFGGGRWEISAAPGYTGPMRDVAGQGSIADAERIDGFFVLDLAAQVRFFEDRLTLYSQFTNVTNNAYVASLRPFGARPGAPFTFVFGIKGRVL